MRAVLDTNVAVSALLWGGPPERLIEAAGEGRLELFTSDALLAEFAGILGRPGRKRPRRTDRVFP